VELQLRNLDGSGTKKQLLDRLREALLANNAVLHRLGIPPTASKAKGSNGASGGTPKRKRGCNRKEPQREEYQTEDEYKIAWQRWRESRDNNNDSVMRSRENAKKKRKDHERMCQERESENTHLEDLVGSLRSEVAFLAKVLTNPQSLNDQEKMQLQSLVDNSN